MDKIANGFTGAAGGLGSPLARALSRKRFPTGTDEISSRWPAGARLEFEK